MPLIPYNELTPQGRVPVSNPLSRIVNPVLDGYCSTLVPVNNWIRDRLNDGIPGLGDIGNIPAAAAQSIICPNVPPQLPTSVAPGIWAQGCASFGSSSGYAQGFNVFGQPFPPFVGTDEWGCADNRGLPVSAPFFKNFTPAGASWGWAVTCERADGSRYDQLIGPSGSGDDPNFYVITSANFFPCPGCTSTPTLPDRPVLPPRLPPGIPQPPPQIPITINIPQPPGFPPLSFPLTYAPITPTLNLNAPITLAPNFNLNPAFNFAPKIEINLGGLSIEGGGYPEPIPDVETIIRETGGDCPDPCPELDYERITEIVFDELDNKFPPSRPFTNEIILLAEAESRTFVLPEFTQWVELTIILPPPNRRSQFGGANGETVYYNGWYSFGVTGATSERYPIHYDFVSIPIPEGVRAFTYTIYVGGTASGRIGYQLPPPF